MAANSSNDWKESVARWSRVCEMGMEAALREAGCSEQRITDIVCTMELQEECKGISLECVGNLIDTDDGRTALLATLCRRRDTSVKVIRPGKLSWQFNTMHAVALMVNISSNTNIQVLELEGLTVFGTVEGASLLGHALATNSSITHLDLQRVDLRRESVRCILKGPESNPNSKLTDLNLMDNFLLDDGVRLVAEFLYSFGRLKYLSIGIGTLGYARPTFSAEGCLASLLVGLERMRKEVMEQLFQALSGYPQNDGVISRWNYPTHSLHLTGGNQEHVECISHMIRTNPYLLKLELFSFSLLPRDWNEHLFPALKDNRILAELAVCNNKGLTEEVFKSLMDLLQNSNTRLRRINLSGTDLTARQGQVNEELRINQAYRYKLRESPQSKITNGRIVFCGYGFAGKTEIAKTMKQREEKGWMPRSLTTGFKKLEQKVGTKAYKQWAERTRGFEVITLKNQPYIKSIWDFAGQKEYYALHDYVFPDNKNSHFLYVCSCRFPPDHPDPAREVKDEKAIRSECEFWMRFVASNSKPGGAVYGQKLPQVSFVLTKTDTITFPQKFISMVEAVVADLRGMFKNVLNLDSTVEVVNSRSRKQVNCLLTTCSHNLKQILDGQEEYSVCQELRNFFEGWSKSNPKQPVLSLDEFHKLCERQKILVTFSDQGRNILLAYLHDLGEIIFPKHSDYIVTNPTWFGIEVLGSMIEAFKGADMPSFKLHHDQGFVTREAMQKHLESSLKRMDLSILAEKLIDLMVLLELCFQSEPEGDEKGKQKIEEGKSPFYVRAGYDDPFFVSPFFDDKTEALEWGLDDKTEELEWGLRHQSGQQKIEKGNSPFFVPAFFDDKTEAAAYYGRRKLEWKLRHQSGQQKIEKSNSPFFVPALFDDKTEAAANGRRQLEWKLRHQSGRVHYLGRRLECKDRSTTFLTPGFFPRLQVHLRNYLHGRKWTKNVFEVGRNLIRFAENGIEVCVEYAGDHDDFIDILVRSSAPFAEALKFIEEHVVKTIRTLCASPQGCQGVVLVESIIRPVCVEHLHLCIQRKAHSVLVSSLEEKMHENEDYRHTWSESLDGESDVVLARDLVRGEDLSLENLSSSDGFPRHFFPSIEDVGSLDRFGTRLNLTKIIPIKLHIQCQHGENCHPVKGQPGRRINLKDTAEGHNFNVGKLAITLLWAGAGATATAFGAPVALPSIDNWVRNLFKASGLPGLDMERLQKLVSTCKSAGPVSEEQILKALKKYWEVDPCSQGLKEFLKLEDGEKFWEDFKLTKVIYTKGEDRGTVGWLCDKHFDEGIQHGILRSAFH